MWPFSFVGNMPWIESHTVLLRHRKVLQLADDLGVSPVCAIGHLHALWHAVLEQQEDGDLSEWPDTMIAQAAAYTGDSVRFVACLQARKWLDGKMVHDWLEYAGRYLAVKYRTANPLKLQKIHSKYKSVSRSVSSRSKVRSKSDNLPNQPDLTKPDLTKPTEPTVPPATASPRGIGKSVETWECYRKAYAKRYGVDPVRNQQVSAMLCRLVDKLGVQDAPHVAAFYLTHNAHWYVQKMHPVNVLLQDAEKLRTEWATNRKVMNSQAVQIDKTAGRLSVFQELIEERKKQGEVINVESTKGVGSHG